MSPHLGPCPCGRGAGAGAAEELDVASQPAASVRAVGSQGAASRAFGNATLNFSRWSCSSLDGELEPLPPSRRFSVPFCLPHAPNPCPLRGQQVVGSASLLLQSRAGQGVQWVPGLLPGPARLWDEELLPLGWGAAGS